jgi:hypothetical protein
MLRALVIAIGVGCIAGAIFLANQVWFAALELGVFGVLILIGTFFERHYRTRRAAGRGWQSTAERFVDPTSGKLVEVRYNPRTGERAYVDAGER